METATQPTLDAVSAYWESRGKTIADKRTGRTFLRSDGVLACDECCFKDRECDTPRHFHRDSCPFCLGTGVNAAPQETPAQQELAFGVIPCPWCGVSADAQDEWGALMTHKPNCYWLNTHGDSIGRVRVDNSTKARWNTRYRDPAFQKLVKAAQFALTTPGLIKGRDELQKAVDEALRLAREGEE